MKYIFMFTIVAENTIKCHINFIYHKEYYECHLKDHFLNICRHFFKTNI
jgi:hypothetical protein